jgi:hypothetical protein
LLSPLSVKPRHFNCSPCGTMSAAVGELGCYLVQFIPGEHMQIVAQNFDEAVRYLAAGMQYLERIRPASCRFGVVK